jgi:heat shock protein HslJ
MLGRPFVALVMVVGVACGGKHSDVGPEPAPPGDAHQPPDVAPPVNPELPAAGLDGDVIPVAEGASPIVGTRWQLVRAEGVDVAQVPAAWFRITPEGRLEGNGGCNSMFGQPTIGADSVSFGGIGSTRMACPNLSQEQALVRALGAVDAWRLDGPELVLTGGGAEKAVFTASPEPPTP